MAAATWRKVGPVPGVPAVAYVAACARPCTTRIRCTPPSTTTRTRTSSRTSRSTDRGRTWTSITGDLPARGTAYAVAEDHVDPQLLFAGTEFGGVFAQDGGQHWLKIAGVPTIAVREIAIQKRDSDLVVGTFGRGIYILDDYAPVRSTTVETLTNAAALYATSVPCCSCRRSTTGIPARPSRVRCSSAPTIRRSAPSSPIAEG